LCFCFGSVAGCSLIPQEHEDGLNRTVEGVGNIAALVGDLAAAVDKNSAALGENNNKASAIAAKVADTAGIVEESANHAKDNATDMWDLLIYGGGIAASIFLSKPIGNMVMNGGKLLKGALGASGKAVAKASSNQWKDSSINVGPKKK